MEDADLVHLAAHGTFRADNPMFSSLRLADGPLSVHDFQRLARSPRIVVLTACSAARSGVYGGDELLGTSVALLALGVRSVVAPFLPVRDDATRTFAVDLHTALALGATPQARRWPRRWREPPARAIRGSWPPRHPSPASAVASGADRVYLRLPSGVCGTCAAPTLSGTTSVSTPRLAHVGTERVRSPCRSWRHGRSTTTRRHGASWSTGSRASPGRCSTATTSPRRTARTRSRPRSSACTSTSPRSASWRSCPAGWPRRRATRRTPSSAVGATPSRWSPSACARRPRWRRPTTSSPANCTPRCTPRSVAWRPSPRHSCGC